MDAELNDSDAELLRHYDHRRFSHDEVVRLGDVMRSSAPLVRSEEMGGFCMISSWEEIRRVEKDWQTFSSAAGVFMPRQDVRLPPIDMDPPEHPFWRGLVAEEFGVRAVRAHEPEIRAEIRRLIDTFIGKGRFDAIRDLGEPLPVQMICSLAGMAHLGAEIRRLTHAFVAATAQGPEAMGPVLGEWAQLMGQELAKRRAEPGDDLMTKLAFLEHDGQPVSPEQVLLFLPSLMVAGHETTISAIGSLILELATRPGLVQRLRDDPSRTTAVVEEVIRVHPPVLQFARVPTRDVELFGHAVEAGCPLVLNYVAANRDPEVFHNPEELDLDRGSNPHLGFGFGPHRCVGAPLARAELRLIAEEVVSRMDDLQLAIPRSEVKYEISGGGLCGLPALPVTFKVRQ